MPLTSQFIFLLALGVQDFVLTNPGGAQALSKEFPASAPQVIQGTIKFPRSNGPKRVNARIAART